MSLNIMANHDFKWMFMPFKTTPNIWSNVKGNAICYTVSKTGKNTYENDMK